jgi:hypothetical protein
MKALIQSFPQLSGERFFTQNFLAKSSSLSHSLFFSKKSSINLSALNLCHVFLSSISASEKDAKCQLAFHVVGCAMIAVSIKIISSLSCVKCFIQRSEIFFFNKAP